MGPDWSRQDPGGPHVGHMERAIWAIIFWKSNGHYWFWVTLHIEDARFLITVDTSHHSVHLASTINQSNLWIMKSCMQFSFVKNKMTQVGGIFRRERQPIHPAWPMSWLLRTGQRREPDRSSLERCNDECGGVSNHRRLDCLLNRLFKRRSQKYQSSASLIFVKGVYRWPMGPPPTGPATRKMFPFDDVIKKGKLLD